jgi:hypothetical protein
MAVWAQTPAPVQSPAVRFGGPVPNEVEAAIGARRANVIEWSRYTGGADPKYAPYDILAATARDGCGPRERAAYMTNLGNMGPTDTAKPLRFEMFALPPLTRYLYMYGQCLSAEQRSSLLKGISETRRFLFGHGTLNHMIMQESSWYLLAQYFPDAIWTNSDNKKYSSAEVMSRIKVLLGKRDWRFFQTAHNELLSPTYSETNLFPTLNLVDFAKDPEVARQAGAEASLEVLLLRAHSYHGVIMPPLTRRNVDQTNAPVPERWPQFPAGGQHVLWYYFGEPRTGRFDLLKPSREPYYSIMLALSTWRPPLAAWSMPAEDYTVRYVTPDFSQFDNPAPPSIYGDTYIGHDYALATGNMVFDPRHYSDHNETFAVAWRSTERRNLFECQQPYWRSDAGEDAWLTDFWSPFMQTYRIDKNRAVLLTSVPAKDPWTDQVEERFWAERSQHKDALIQMVQCRVPRAVDELAAEGQWIFFRSGHTYVAVESLKGPFEEVTNGLSPILAADFTIFKIREAKTALFVMVDDEGRSFAQFRSRAKAAAPAYDESTSTLTTRGADDELVSVRFVAPFADPSRRGYWRSLPEVKVNGTIQAYRDTPVFETPFLKLDDGVLRVTGSNALELRGPVR